MRLLLVHLLETPLLVSDGVAVHLRGITRGLRSFGHEVRLVSFADIPHPLKNEYRKFIRRMGEIGEPGAVVRETFRIRADLIREAVRKALSAGEGGGPFDAVIAEGMMEVHAVPEGFGPIILAIHAFRSDDEERKGNLRPGSDELVWFRAREVEALLRADGIAAVSKEYLDEAERRMREADPAGHAERRDRPQALVRNGIDHSLYKPGSNLRRRLGIDDRYIIGILGRISRQKGHATLLDAFSIVRASHPNTTLLIGGDGELREEMEKKASDLGLGDSVRFLGEIGDVPTFLRTLDLGVLPSRWEGLPYVLLEYGAAGLPVVATDVGGVPDLIRSGETGILVKPDDPESLATSMSIFINEPVISRCVGDALRRRIIDDYSIEATASDYISLIEEVLRPASAPGAKRSDPASPL